MRATAASLFACGALLAACGSGAPRSGTRPAAPSTGAAQRAARLRELRAALPVGFTAGAPSSPGAGPAPLAVAPAAGMTAAMVHLAPVPAGGALRRALALLVDTPAPVIARPIFLSASAVHPGQRIAVAAAHLGTAPSHAALFILQGPAFRAEHLVDVAYQVAAGYVTLPRVMARGSWLIAAEDISELRRSSRTTTRGSVLVDVGVLRVR